MSTSVNCSSEISNSTPLKAIQSASPWLQLVSRRISNAAQARSICPGLRGGNTFYEDILDWGRSRGELLLLKIARDGCTVGCMVYSSRGLVQVSWGLVWGLWQAGKQLSEHPNQYVFPVVWRPLLVVLDDTVAYYSAERCYSYIPEWSNSKCFTVDLDSGPRLLLSHQLYITLYIFIFKFEYFTQRGWNILLMECRCRPNETLNTRGERSGGNLRGTFGGQFFF